MSAKQRKKLEEAEQALEDYRSFVERFGTPHNVLLRAQTAERQVAHLEGLLREARAELAAIRAEMQGDKQ